MEYLGIRTVLDWERYPGGRKIRRVEWASGEKDYFTEACYMPLEEALAKMVARGWELMSPLPDEEGMLTFQREVWQEEPLPEPARTAIGFHLPGR